MEIAEHVLHRNRDFNPVDDASVRKMATLTRQHLETYYSASGARDAIIVTLPIRSYIPKSRSRKGPEDHVTLKAPQALETLHPNSSAKSFEGSAGVTIAPAAVSRSQARLIIQPLLLAFVVALVLAFALLLNRVSLRTSFPLFRFSISPPFGATSYTVFSIFRAKRFRPAPGWRT